MYVLYNTVLILLTVLLSPLIGGLLLFRRKHRCGFLQKCGFISGIDNESALKTRPIWVHAVSVGEVMATIPFLKELKKRYPDIPVVLSTVTETGNLTARRNAKDADHVIYFPFDYPVFARRLVLKVNPLVFVTFETEIWPNILRELSRRNIPSIVVSGRISHNSFKRYYMFRFFFKKVLSYISCFCMQTGKDAERIISVGAVPERVRVTGNIKFDHQIPAITSDETDRIYRDFNIDKKKNIFIAGSTHRGEEKIVADVFRALRKKVSDLVLILAPRHPERFDEVYELLIAEGIRVERKTSLILTGAPAPDVILLDTIGELSKIYSIATIVFIGGSLVPVGGHNVLEPAVFSKPVIFGNQMWNFLEISKILKRKKAAIQVAGEKEFTEQALELLQDINLRRQIGNTAFNVIMENSGALGKSIEVLMPLLKRKVG